MNAKRGFVPEDEKYFSAEAIETMRIAAGHILYLINAEYDLKQAATFVGNHFLLSERQRLAIMRSVATHEQVRSRREKSVDLLEVEGQEVWIDGFNIIITLEVLLSDSLIFECMDGSIRDLAALRGTYRIIPETRGAIRLLLEELQAACVKKANILLDEPVSNSGRLKVLIAEIGEEYALDLDIRICKNPDRELFGKENVISSDSVVLDHCKSWINLTSAIVQKTGKRPIRVWSATP